MNILLANPNTSQSVTDRIAAVARAAVSPGTTVTAVTATAGVPYIATRAEAVIGARGVVQRRVTAGAELTSLGRVTAP